MRSECNGLEQDYLMVGNARVCHIAQETANGDAYHDTSIENSPLPLQLWMLGQSPWLLIVLAGYKTRTLELPPTRLERTRYTSRGEIRVWPSATTVITDRRSTTLSKWCCERIGPRW